MSDRKQRTLTWSFPLPRPHTGIVVGIALAKGKREVATVRLGQAVDEEVAWVETRAGYMDKYQLPPLVE